MPFRAFFRFPGVLVFFQIKDMMNNIDDNSLIEILSNKSIYYKYNILISVLVNLAAMYIPTQKVLIVFKASNSNWGAL